MSPDPSSPTTQARDVIAFGHEVGRVMSDGTIVGRAEPFAKVFPSSRRVKRAVGVMAWAILEDIALDAHLDVEGRLVADTNVRRIADNLGVSKNTVATHLARLRGAGFVLHEEGHHDPTGRYTTSRYVLDPSACVERFTHTPSPTNSTDSAAPENDPASADHAGIRQPLRDAVEEAPAVGSTTPATSPTGDPVESVTGPVLTPANSTDRAESSSEDGFSPCPNNWDTDPMTVSQSMGHRELGHKNKEEVLVSRRQHRAREATPPGHQEAVDLLTTAGITPARAANLAARHPHDRISDTVDAATTQSLDNPAGWIVTALSDGWDIADLATQAKRERERHAQARRQIAQRRHVDQTAAHQAVQQQTRNHGWANIAAANLDIDQLARLIWRLRDPRFPASTRSARITEAKVIGWVAAACQHHADLPPSHAVAQALTDPATIPPAASLPAPPSTDAPTGSLTTAIAAALHQLERSLSNEPHRESPIASHAYEGLPPDNAALQPRAIDPTVLSGLDRTVDPTTEQRCVAHTYV